MCNKIEKRAFVESFWDMVGIKGDAAMFSEERLDKIIKGIMEYSYKNGTNAIEHVSNMLIFVN